MAVPVAATALTVPMLAKAKEAEDPTLPLYRQWLEARANWLRLADLPGNGNFDTAESKVEEAKEHAAFKAMSETTPTSLAGIAALAHALWDLDGPATAMEHDMFNEMANSQNCKLIRAIWRAASGANGFPSDGDTVTSA